MRFHKHNSLLLEKWATSPTKELRGYCKQIKIASMFSRWRLLWFEKSDLYFVQMFHYTFPTTKNKVAMIIINNFSIKRTFFCRKITLFEKNAENTFSLQQRRRRMAKPFQPFIGLFNLSLRYGQPTPLCGWIDDDDGGMH